MWIYLFWEANLSNFFDDKRTFETEPKQMVKIVPIIFEAQLKWRAKLFYFQ